VSGKGWNMKRLGVMAAALALATAPLAQAEAAEISKDEIAEILTEQGYAVRDLSANSIAVTVSDYIILVGVDGADSDISYQTYLPGIRGDTLSYEFLNTFNNDVKFGRAYIDRDGDIAIQMDRNSAGGVSAENIESDFYIFLLLIDAFLSQLEALSVA
jgi:hypothetical protein